MNLVPSPISPAHAAFRRTVRLGRVRERMPVAVLGATGVVGQHLVRLLADHPWMEVSELVASRPRAGATYGEVVRWSVGAAPPPHASRVRLSDPRDPLRSRIVLSALPADVARGRETELAERGHIVCSNASAHRLDPRVPLIIPEVNAHALELTDRQPWRTCGGALVTNPNCVVAGLALALAPIERACGIRSATVVTLQALSGAGLDGPSALGLVANVVPGIPGEEEKIGPELDKLLGIRVPMAVATNRVSVVDGHTAHVFLQLDRRTGVERIRTLLGAFGADPEIVALPSLGPRPLRVRAEPDRPQPRLDIQADGGMAVTVGRIRSAPPHDIAMVFVVHNAVRGAAGACLSNAELCIARGMADSPGSRA